MTVGNFDYEAHTTNGNSVRTRDVHHARLQKDNVGINRDGIAQGSRVHSHDRDESR